MNVFEKAIKKIKQFKPTSWSIDNRTAIYIIAILVTIYGLTKFNTMPKEQFPDIVVPTISITTVYVGNSPKDIENLVTRPIEKQLKGISGAKVKKIQSTSQTDYSLIVVEFDTDVENAVNRENRDITGGLVEVGNMKRTLRLKGQFTTALDLRNIVVRSSAQGATVYLRDIAELKDTVKEKENFARLDGKNVITLNIVKRSGENLIEAADKIKAAVKDMQDKEELPKDLKVVITGDQSKLTKTSFNELVNTIIIGFILVLLILMFFMGVTNAFFVALSVPLSVFVAFLFLPIANSIIGTTVTLNFIVLFALLFGLGIIVDDAIVVIENTHRIYGNGKMPIVKAAKEAAGEVFVPVLAGTATTLAPFFPLLFWKRLIGKFMIYLPTILILTLAASLIVAFIFNPVFAVSFMKPEGKEHAKPKKAVFRNKWFLTLLIGGIVMHLGILKIILND